MPINSLKFMKIFLDKFSKKYKDLLPQDVISAVILTVLDEAPETFFSYDLVQEHSDFCKKCGSCCKQALCPINCFNGRTCDDYYARPEECAEFPYYNINGDAGLWLDPGCQFALKLAEMQIEKDIKREIKFLLEDD